MTIPLFSSSPVSKTIGHVLFYGRSFFLHPHSVTFAVLAKDYVTVQIMNPFFIPFPSPDDSKKKT